MRKKFFLVLVAVGLIFFLSLEADAKKAVSKEGRKEKTGNQLVVEKERMKKMKTVNENGYDKNSAGYGDDKCVDEDEDHDKDGEDEDDGDGEDEGAGSYAGRVHFISSHRLPRPTVGNVKKNRTHGKPPIPTLACSRAVQDDPLN